MSARRSCAIAWTAAGCGSSTPRRASLKRCARRWRRSAPEVATLGTAAAEPVIDLERLCELAEAGAEESP